MDIKRKADIIAWLHFFWIVIGLVSLPMLIILKWWYIIAALFIVMTLLSWTTSRGCWLLRLENTYRAKTDSGNLLNEQAYIQYYLAKVFHVHWSKPAVRTINYVYMIVLMWFTLWRMFL